jgi:hypothetical protein
MGTAMAAVTNAAAAVAASEQIAFLARVFMMVSWGAKSRCTGSTVCLTGR